MGVANIESANVALQRKLDLFTNVARRLRAPRAVQRLVAALPRAQRLHPARASLALVQIPTSQTAA